MSRPLKITIIQIVAAILIIAIGIAMDRSRNKARQPHVETNGIPMSQNTKKHAVYR